MIELNYRIPLKKHSKLQTTKYSKVPLGVQGHRIRCNQARFKDNQRTTWLECLGHIWVSRVYKCGQGLLCLPSIPEMRNMNQKIWTMQILASSK